MLGRVVPTVQKGEEQVVCVCEGECEGEGGRLLKGEGVYVKETGVAGKEGAGKRGVRLSFLHERGEGRIWGRIKV